MVIIVGNGSLFSKLQTQIKDLGLEEYVSLCGHKSPRQLKKLYSSSDAYVLSSIYEGMPLSLLEAWAIGLPTIATSVGNISNKNEFSEFVSYVDSEDKTSLMNKMNELIGDSRLRNKLSLNSKKLVANYSWEKIANSYQALYESAMLPHLVHAFPYYPPHVGGAEQRIEDLINGLSVNGYEVDMVTSDIGSKPGEYIQKNIAIHRLRSMRIGPTPIIFLLPYVLWKQSKKNKTIFHVHIAHAFLPEVAFLIAKLKHVPYIAHIRLNVKKSSKWGLFLPIYKKIILGPILRGSDKVIVLTHDYVEVINNEFGVDKSKIIVIPNATSFSINTKPNYNIHKIPRLLFVGRLAPQKNIPLLLSAIKMLINEKKIVNLIIVGEGEDKDKILRTIKDLNLNKYIKLKGILTGKDLIDIYKDSDIVIQTSFEEGFSSVLIEAMASAKPVIASDIEGTRSIIKDNFNGLLIDPYSITSLVNSIKMLINETSTRKLLVRNGLNEVRMYKWDIIVSQVEKIYVSMLVNN
jgi:glycosyltransferase involved in cell wall biosynthesis